MTTTDAAIKKVPLNKLECFPISLFTVTMGLGGLTIAYEKASLVSDIPALISIIMSFIVLVIFGLIFTLYTLKTVHHFAAVKAEFSHPIKLNFFPTISISLLLLSGCFLPIHATSAQVFGYIGTIVHLGFTFYIMSTWLGRSLEIQLSNPAWFIPVMGNVIVPIVGASYMPYDVLVFFLSIGVFLWLTLFTIVFHRVVFHPQLPEKFIPTLFIFIAPPAVISIAYYQVAGTYDLFAQILYDLGLFFALLLMFMFKHFARLPFFLSWWAFTFPLAAITIASLLRYQVSQQDFFWYLGMLLLIITTLVIALVATKTIQFLLQEDMCVHDK